MIADFYDTFDEDSMDKSNIIPQEVLKILEDQLPSNFTYYIDDSGKNRVGPKNGAETVTIKFNIEQSFIDENLKDIPKDKLPEYIYRMQLIVPINNSTIGDTEKQIPIEETIGNALENPPKIEKAYLYPEPFPPAKVIVFETDEGDKVHIQIGRKPYNSFHEILFSNVNFPALRIELLIDEDTKKTKLAYSVSPKKAETVREALAAVRIIKGLYNGNLKINGNIIPENTIGKAEFDISELEKTENFWLKAKKIEDILGVSFNPGAEYSEDDAKLLSHLDICLLRNQYVIWDHPFDHFHIAGIAGEEKTFENYLNREPQDYTFFEGPIPMTLMGTGFELYSNTVLSKVVMTNIVWDNDDRNSGEIYVSDPVDGKWKLYRKYFVRNPNQTLTEDSTST